MALNDTWAYLCLSHRVGPSMGLRSLLERGTAAYRWVQTLCVSCFVRSSIMYFTALRARAPFTNQNIPVASYVLSRYLRSVAGVLPVSVHMFAPSSLHLFILGGHRPPLFIIHLAVYLDSCRTTSHALAMTEVCGARGDFEASPMGLNFCLYFGHSGGLRLSCILTVLREWPPRGILGLLGPYFFMCGSLS